MSEPTLEQKVEMLGEILFNFQPMVVDLRINGVISKYLILAKPVQVNAPFEVVPKE